jgi:hypothetical protein
VNADGGGAFAAVETTTGGVVVVIVVVVIIVGASNGDGKPTSVVVTSGLEAVAGPAGAGNPGPHPARLALPTRRALSAPTATSSRRTVRAGGFGRVIKVSVSA